MLDVALQQIAELETENERLRVRLSSPPGPTTLPASVTDLGIRPDKPDSASEGLPYADGRSSPAERIALFRALFVGRTDVYARRWVSKNGRVGWSPAEESPWEKNKLEHERVFFPLTDDVIGRHLRRPVSERDELHAGLYPLLPDDTTQLLVCDFDGKSGSKDWRGDADAYLRACADVGTPALLEISRSGEGAHVWVFFTEPVEAVAARTLGMGLIRQAIDARDGMSLSSYDRLIPSQDFVPTHSKKGARFGNLIALPLSGAAHASGTTLFCDPATWTPYRDQFAHLSGTGRLSPQRLKQILDELGPLKAGPSPTSPALPARPRRGGLGQAPATVKAVAGPMLHIATAGLPPQLVAALKHAASFHNPEFYRRQNQRFTTFFTPRLVCCFDDTDPDWLAMPRGLRDEAAALVAAASGTLKIRPARRRRPRSSPASPASSPKSSTPRSRLCGHTRRGYWSRPPGRARR